MIDNKVSSINDFELLTLSSQLEHLTRALESQPAFDLIQLCGPIRDPAPLAWLSRQLLERGWFIDESHRNWFADFLVGLPETTVDKLLKSMVTTPLPGQDSSPGERRQSLCQVLLRALWVVPLTALSSMCLIDRTVKNHFPDEREGHINRVFNEIENQIKSGKPEAVPLAFLAQMTSTAITSLERIAASVDDRCLAAFKTHRQQLAQEAIQILEDAPKAVSQANAEDLLARRVYTDPGHFLIELLQNAEDSGAKVWRVICDGDKLIIWHDGIPFDTRDLVGITSIGQTTKRKQQIGFFGVGFKSVYEVTDRPQIYSDVYNFEIADVSIPKLLAQRPSYLPSGGTAVVLPLRGNLDNERSPRALFEKGAALDSCVLLTLRSIEEIEFQLTEDGGGPAQHTLIECAGANGTTIRHEPSGNIVAYLIQDDEYTYSGVVREAGRPDSTKVMVGILLNDAGHPQPLPETAAEVYSYLPTREQPGLRFFVQGHFDVPVDRERIAPDSVWNRWIVSQVPIQLARLAQRLGKDNNVAAAAGFIDVLPLKRDLPNAPFAQIPLALSTALNKLVFVPVLSDNSSPKLVSPQQTIVAPSSIIRLFEHDQIGNDRFFLAPELPERHQEILLELGAESFSTASLISYLENRLAELDGDIPNFMQNPEKLELLYDLLLTELELLDRQGEKTELTVLLKRLQSLPLVPDTLGRLRPPDQLVRGSSVIRRIYADNKHFITPGLEEANSRTFAFFDKLGVEKIDVEYLVSDLETRVGNLLGPLELPRASFPSDENCVNTILEAFVSADWNILQRVAQLPLFRSANGKFYPMATNASDHNGVLHAGNQTAKDIAQFYGAARPIAEPRPTDSAAAFTGVATPTPYQDLLDRLPVPGVTLSVLSDDLQNSLFKNDLNILQQLHELLEKHVEDISDKISKQLVQLPIWPDRTATPRSLSGPNRVFIPADDTICEIFPGAPFLDRTIAERRHTLNMSIQAVSVNQVIEALTPDGQPPLLVAREKTDVDRALSYILAHAQQVDSTGLRTLKDRVTFLSDRGEVLPLANLSRAETTELRSIYADAAIRNFIDEDGKSWSLIKELGLESSLISANVELLADDLEADLDTEQKLKDPETAYRAILVYISKRVDKMTRSLILRFSAFPIFPDTTGATGTLSNERADRSPKFVYPASGQTRKVLALTAVRLLNAEIENIIRPLIIAAKIPEAGFGILVDSLFDHPITDETTLDLIQDLFVNKKLELQELFPPGDRVSRPNQVLNKLPIWKTLSGDCKGAREIMDGNLSELFEPETAEYDDLLKVCIKPAALNRLNDLSPLMVALEPENFLADLIKRTAKPGKPLSTQPYFLSSVERVLRLYEVIGARNKVELPGVNAAGNLTFSKLFYTDSETLALLSDLPVLEDVLHADLTSYFELGKDEPGRFSNLRHTVAKLWTKMISSRGSDDFPRLPAAQVIAALPADSDVARRSRFYRWLLNNKLTVFDDKSSVAKLLETPLFQTKNGNLVKPGDLVFDGDMPDLGIDWLPGPDIPKPLLETLRIHLDIGQLNVDELIRRHVVPAYELATANGDHLQAGKLLTWLATRLTNRSESEIRRLLKGKTATSIMLEAADGSFHLPQDLFLPAPEIRQFVRELWEELPQPSELRYNEDVYPFLVQLGVSTTPNIDLVSEKLVSISTRNQSLALAHVVQHVRNLYGENLYKKLPSLRTAKWLVNGDGALKSPNELYVRSYEIETLIGPFADLYLEKSEEDILGQALVKGLGFREIDEISTAEIFSHLDYRAKRKEAISQRTYGWLDLAACQGDLKALDVEQHFGDRPWILTDDGEYRSHNRVIGTRAFHLFGNLRGYWTLGWKQYPGLCKILGINEGTTPRAVQGFIEEVGLEVAKNGSKELLKREPALPLMLTNCFAVLSKKGLTVSRDLPVIPAIHKQSVELMRASADGIYWSDTPTLEVLFAGVGKLYLARRGTTDDADDIDAFYTSMGILRLRDTYKVVAAKREGSDRSDALSQQILALRQVLRGLLGIMPRIQLERELNPDTTWVYSKHLRTLAASGSIKAIEHLKVRYVLPGVGETEVERPAAYDTARGELLVDTKVLADPDLTGLSEGLLPAIIEGPSAEAFVDLFEILLARRTMEDMSAYLNRRHFAEAHVSPTTVDRIAQRIGELLDYGLAEKLSKRFSVFDRKPLDKWREPVLIKEIESLATNDADRTAAETVKTMLRAVGIDGEEKELEELLKKLLLAPSISECSELLLVKSDEKLNERDKVVSRKSDRQGTQNQLVNRPAEADSASSTRTGNGSDGKPVADQTAGSSDGTTLQGGFKNFFGQLFGKSRSDSESTGTPQNQHEKASPVPSGRANDSDKHEETRQEDDHSLPSDLLGNYFAPSKAIPPQIWTTSKNAKALESMKKEAFLNFSPGRLPPPYLYSVNKIGVNFNPVLQEWTPGRSTQKFFLTPGDNWGRTVSFSGQFYAGKSRLPLPLYSELVGTVTVDNGSLKSLVHDEIGVIIELAGRGVINIKYDVEVKNVPQLRSNITPLAAPDRALVTPTVALSMLPQRVVDFVTEMNNSDLPEPKRALATQDFIRGNYQYDAGFLEREDVKRKRASLPLFFGNHHLELLHASGDDQVLGRGVCFELNVLLVELLRHLKIPSFIAIGWVLDEGVVDLSDHLFALALIDSEDGPCLLPLDSAATDRGPIRTIQRRRFPTPAKDLTARPSIPTVKGSWNISPKTPSTTRATSTEGGISGDLPSSSAAFPIPRKTSKAPAAKAGDSKRSFLDMFNNDKRRSDDPKDTDNKTVSKALSEERIAQERKIRKQLEDTLAKERLLRQRAETLLGEERRLRRRAEEKHDRNPHTETASDSSMVSNQDSSNTTAGQKLDITDFRIAEPRRQADEFNLLCRAYDLVIEALGLEASAYPMGSEGLRQKLIKLLGSTAVVETFLRVLRGEQTQTSVLTEELRFLEELQLIEIETVPTLRIHITDSSVEAD